MYRQSPSRNQRLKEIKVKHVWQMCLFLGVCFWLIYQVKRSHDEKKGFDESDVKASLASGHSNIVLKLGRKDIHPRVVEMTEEYVEENKHEEDGLEDMKDEEKESGGMDGGDETFDTEADRENSFDSKREGEEGDENENEEKDSEDVNGQMENEKESQVEETDRDGDDMSSHDSLEEHYKADDASTEETSEGEKRKELEVEFDAMVKDDTESNVSNNETEENPVSNRHSETSESESEYVPEILTKNTSVEDSNLQENDSEKTNSSTLNVDDNHLGSESTGPDETKILESEGTKNLEEIQRDSIDLSDSSDSSKEKDDEDVGTDLDTLPEIQAEDTDSEDGAAA